MNPDSLARLLSVFVCLLIVGGAAALFDRCSFSADAKEPREVEELLMSVMHLHAIRAIATECKASNTEAIILDDPKPTLDTDGPFYTYVIHYELNWKLDQIVRRYKGTMKLNKKSKAWSWEPIDLSNPPEIILHIDP